MQLAEESLATVARALERGQISPVLTTTASAVGPTAFVPLGLRP